MVRTVNLRGINYLGSVRDKKGFCHFQNVTYEFRAFTLNLLTKLKRYGDEFPRNYIGCYAPSDDGNDTVRYYNLCAALLKVVMRCYRQCLDNQKKRFDLSLRYLSYFYACALALYRCQQVIESGYNIPEFSQEVDFEIVPEDKEKFFSGFPSIFRYFWHLGSNSCNLVSWIVYSRFTLSNKWLMMNLYTSESHSKPSFKCQLDLYNTDLLEIISQLHLEVVSDDDYIILSHHYAEQVRKFPISQIPTNINDYGFEFQEHPSASRVVTLDVFDHSDTDEVFPFPREKARP